MRLITVKNIDDNKSAKIWLDSRWPQSWHNFDNYKEGDLVTNLHDISGYKGTLNADSVIPAKKSNGISLEVEVIDKPLLKEDSKCKQCNKLWNAVNSHMTKDHQLSLGLETEDNLTTKAPF